MIEGEKVKIPDTNGKGRSHTCVKCNNCSTLFYKPSRFVSEATLNFCSRKCTNRHKSKGNTTEVVCSCCGIFFRKKNSSLGGSKSGLYFCSRECKDKAQSISFGLPDIWPEHYTDGSYGDYRKKVNLDSCSKCGYSEHPEILQVHHKDRDRSNNNLDNLETLCPNCHMWEHYSNKDGLYNRRL